MSEIALPTAILHFFRLRTMRVDVSRAAVDSDAQRADLAMSRHAEGDPAAFEVLYDALAPSLRRFLLSLTRDSSLTDDLLQQTFLHMHDKRAHFVVGAPVKPWALAIARRLFIDHYRRAKREISTEGAVSDEPRDEDNPEAWHLADEAAQLAAAELGQLAPAQLDAYLLVKEQGLSPGDAASVLGITSIAVRVRVHRAVVALRAALGLSGTADAGDES